MMSGRLCHRIVPTGLRTYYYQKAALVGSYCKSTLRYWHLRQNPEVTGTQI